MAISQIPPYYRAGTATFNATATVTGQGTAWLAEVMPGDQIFNRLGQMAVVDTVNSNTSITLVAPFAGTAQAAQAYTIYRVPDSVRLENFSQRSANLLAKGNLQAISDQEFAPNKLIKPIGPGAVALQDFALWAQSMLALPGVADQLPYTSGVNAAAFTPLTAFARTLLGGGNQAAMLAILGVLFPAQSSITDATLNRLMRNGGWGLGGNSVDATDLDNLAQTQAFNFGNSAIGLPTSMSGQGIHIAVAGSAAGMQIVSARHASNQVAIYYRTKSGPTWGPWVRLDTQRGSNANGEWVRFPDGTQICSFRSMSGSLDRSAWGSGLYQSGNSSWTFPAAFSSAPIITGESADSSNVGLISSLSVTASGCNLRAISPSATVTTQVLRPIATGRWF